MDQDLNYQKQISFASGAVTEFFQVPYRCTVREVRGIVQADPGDSQTITFTKKGTGEPLGVLTFGDTIAPGAVSTYVSEATGRFVLEQGDIIQMVTSAGTAAACDLNLELDPYGRA
ncbi:MAG: hypothetical protein JEZ12_13100 [Desulfobacterium sp.]|nr:hypothetical protein [Desulfobacterium sp.]